MKTTKPWYLSMGVWGGLIAALMPVVTAIFALDAETAAALMQQSEVIAGGAVTVIGGLLALIGRFRAKSQVTVTKKSPLCLPLAAPLALVLAASFISACSMVGDAGTRTLGDGADAVPVAESQTAVRDTRGVSIDMGAAEVAALILLAELEVRYPEVRRFTDLPEDTQIRARRWCEAAGLIADTVVVDLPGYDDVTAEDVNALCDGALGRVG